MYTNSYYPAPINHNYDNIKNYDDRFIAGGFAAPFLLGGLTGAVLSPYFMGNRPPYNTYYNYYYPPYYRPYPGYYR